MTRKSAALAAVMLAVVMVLGAGPTAAQTGATGTNTETGGAGRTGEAKPRLTADDALARIKAAGYTDIEVVEFSYGRYEFNARDPKKRQVRLLVDPNSGEIDSRLLGPPGSPGRLVSVEEILPKVKAAGFEDVLLIEREHSLYEILALDAQGRKIEMFVHPKTGELLAHPKTGELLWKEVQEEYPFELTLTVDKIVAIVEKAGYPAVYGVAHENMLYRVHAHDDQGRIVYVYLDPKTGRIVKQP